MGPHLLKVEDTFLRIKTIARVIMFTRSRIRRRFKFWIKWR
jgi:hypothetical protein